jgi:hypothetical protein
LPETLSALRGRGGVFNARLIASSRRFAISWSVSSSDFGASVMRHTYYFTPVVDQRYYTAIGRLIVTWAFLETEIDRYVRGLLNHKNTWSHPLSNTMDRVLPHAFNRRVTLWRRLARIHFKQTELAAIKDIISRCKTAHAERNKMAHGRWSLDVRSDRLYVGLMKPGNTPRQEQPITVEQIRDSISDTSKLIGELYEFDRAHFPYSALPRPNPKLLVPTPER